MYHRSSDFSFNLFSRCASKSMLCFSSRCTVAHPLDGLSSLGMSRLIIIGGVTKKKKRDTEMAVESGRVQVRLFQRVAVLNFGLKRNTELHSLSAANHLFLSAVNKSFDYSMSQLIHCSTNLCNLWGNEFSINFDSILENSVTADKLFEKWDLIQEGANECAVTLVGKKEKGKEKIWLSQSLWPGHISFCLVSLLPENMWII